MNDDGATIDRLAKLQLYKTLPWAQAVPPRVQHFSGRSVSWKPVSTKFASQAADSGVCEAHWVSEASGVHVSFRSRLHE